MDEIDETERDNFKTLTLDVDYYQSFLDDVDIPDDQKQEFIETLWNIMVQFVDMGFGIEPIQIALQENQKPLLEMALPLLEKEKDSELAAKFKVKATQDSSKEILEETVL